MWLVILSTLLLVSSRVNAQKNTNFYPNRTGIVHLFEWPFRDIERECVEFLGPHGYAGVQVSPVNENAIVPGRPWWERYQPISYKLVTRSGNENEFRNMIARCNQAGIRIYVDVVINHMAAGVGIVNGTGGSIGKIDTRDYPGVPYTLHDFHPICSINNYNDPAEVRNCELVGLPDLNQTIPDVRKRIVEFMNHLIGLGIAGFRVDASKHMWPNDLNNIYKELNNLNEKFFPSESKPFIYHEVIDFGNEAIKKNEYTPMGAVTEFRHSMEIGRAISRNNQLKWLQSWGPAWGFLPSADAIVFIDNHDNQRGQGAGGSNILNYKSPRKYIMATAFMLAHPYGNPRIMSSFKFDKSDQGPPADENENIISPSIDKEGKCVNGWVCEHRWTSISNMINFRNFVNQNGSPISKWWDNGNNQIAFCRGEHGMIVINNENSFLDVILDTCLPSGTYCDVISGHRSSNGCTGSQANVDELHKVHIQLEGFSVLAIHGGAIIENDKNDILENIELNMTFNHVLYKVLSIPVND